MGHKLTAEEKRAVAEQFLAKRKAKNAQASDITVKVGNEVGPDGMVPITLIRISKTVMPEGWTPPVAKRSKVKKATP